MDNINWGDLLFGFNGRINRAKYWLGILVCVVASIVASILGALLGSMIGTLLTGVVSLATLIISIAIGVKRLHDRDKSGWWLLLFLLAPSVLLGFGLMASVFGLAVGGSGTTGILMSLAGTAIAIWAFVELGCLRGTVGPNRYGPDPLGGNIAMAPRV
ncbi:MAG TPA: DUF805 domain-containing protein [Xanthobacteraceae bacterium]|jgi:uncharacterized membrane protein YhaH (DUF805 family)